jgi:hypothetical protein
VEDAHPYEPATELSIEVRDGVFFVVDARGGVKDILPVEAQLAVLLDDGVLYATQAGLVLKRVASETRIKCAGVTELRAMSREYVQVSTLDGELVLRVTSGREALFALPPVPSAEVVE